VAHQRNQVINAYCKRMCQPRVRALSPFCHARGQSPVSLSAFSRILGGTLVTVPLANEC
jgi:hypothetical protein